MTGRRAEAPAAFLRPVPKEKKNNIPLRKNFIIFKARRAMQPLFVTHTLTCFFYEQSIQENSRYIEEHRQKMGFDPRYIRRADTYLRSVRGPAAGQYQYRHLRLLRFYIHGYGNIYSSRETAQTA
ncbi:hypothetical protein [Chitinophaga lutea]|nr:hypothetical protein [Chitinophaga lutea]